VSDSVSVADVLAAAGRWGMLVGITIVVGAVSCRLLLAMIGQPLQPGPDRDRRAAAWGLSAACVLVLSAALRLVGQAISLADPGQTPAEWRHLYVSVIAHTNWGHVWLAQIALALIAAAAFADVRRGSRMAWVVAGGAAVGLAITPALAGHAIGVDRYRAAIVAADALHVIAASSWLGTLCVLAGAMLPGVAGPQRRSAQDWAADIAALVRAFSPAALGAAAVVAATGVLSAYVHLDAVSSLWRTTYGQALVLKLTLVVLVLAAGAYNWRRGTPGLTTPGGVRRFTRSVSVELTLGALVLLATAVLIGLPLPGMG
jgi:putative copper resistance protein D